MNKTLSIIGIILFGLAVYDCLTTFSLVEPLLNDIETVGNLASLFDEGDDISSQVDELYGSLGIYLIASIFGLIISILSFSKSRKKASITDVSDQLRELGQLKEGGLLSEDGFEAKKREIMMKNK